MQNHLVELNASIDRLRKATAIRDRPAMRAAIRHLLDSGAPLGGQWRNIAEMMVMMAEYAVADAAMQAFVAAKDNAHDAVFSRVVLLTRSGRAADAYALLNTIPDTTPDIASNAYIRGNIAITLGDTHEGRRQLQRVLNERPGWGPAWLSLASTVNFAKDADLADRLVADGKVARSHPDGDRARYDHALGKMHADRGKAKEAFAAFLRGGRLLKAERNYQRAADRAHAEAATVGYDAQFLDDLEGEPRDGETPVFVTGLPRSGTTLVEQILTSHSAIEDGGELNIMQHVAVALGGTDAAAITRYRTKHGSLADLSALYMRLVGERFSRPGRFVDKTIDNSRYMGLIASLFPDAPIVWMRRDPLDNAWSCFRTFFSQGAAWSYSLEDIAYHMMLEDRLLGFWQSVLGRRLLVVPYGDLVDEPGAWIRKLIAFCGLAEEPAVFVPHETRRLVGTASSLQVRRPINREGIGVSRPYRHLMGDFTRTYESLIEPAATPLTG